MIYRHQHFQLDTETNKVFDEDGKELVLVGNSYRVLVFLCANKNASLTQIGDFLDWAKEYTENHLRQYRYKINSIIGNTVVEYKNNIYSLVGEVENAEKIRKNDRITAALQPSPVKLGSEVDKSIKMMKSLKFPAVIAVALFILSFLNWPYSYYSFLRIVVCGVSIYYACVVFSRHNTNTLFWILAGIAILFNPIAPIYIRNRNTWQIIDVIVAIFFIFIIYKFRKDGKAV